MRIALIDNDALSLIPDMSESNSPEAVGARIREARKAAGFKTAKSYFNKAKIPQSTYSRHETGDRVSRSAIRKYANDFGVSAAWLLFGEGAGPQGLAQGGPPDSETVEVVGEVQAGVWKEAIETPPGERQVKHVPTSDRFPGLPRFALRVVGDSMDQKFQEGWTLLCVRVAEIGRPPQDGDYVIIHRHDEAGATEATVKRLEIRENVAWLRAESSNPEFAGAIRLGEVTVDEHGRTLPAVAHAGGLSDDGDIVIVAIVDEFLGRP